MKRFFLAGAMLVAILVAAGCGSSSSEGGSTAGTDTGSSASIDELRWGSPPVQRADFVTSFSHETGTLLVPVLQGLMTFEKEGKVIPGVAESVDNPDPTTYIYNLKKDLKFSDGKPVTVEDVLFSLNRNLGKDSQLASYFENVASIKAKGSDAVEVKLKEPEVAWPSIPAFAGLIMQKAAAENGGISEIGTPSNLPVGSGPYKFTSFNPSVGATLEPNPYWTGPKPTVQKVTIKFLSDDSQQALALRSGEIDGSLFITSQRSFEFPGATLLPTEGTIQTALSLNTIVAPFDDVHVRKAIAYATNREGMAQAVYGGAAEPNQTLTPVSLYGNIAPASEVESTFASLPDYEFDLDAAKQELSKSKSPDGFSTSIAVLAGSPSVKMAQVMAPDFAKIGIKLEIEQLPVSGYLEKLYGPRENLGAIIDEYGANYPDPSTMLLPWLSPEQAKVNGLNSANYKNDEMTQLLDAQAKESDPTKRLQVIGEVFQLMNEDLPYVPLLVPDRFMVISDKYVFNDFSTWTAEFTPWPLLIKQAS